MSLLFFLFTVVISTFSEEPNDCPVTISTNSLIQLFGEDFLSVQGYDLLGIKRDESKNTIAPFNKDFGVSPMGYFETKLDIPDDNAFYSFNPSINIIINTGNTKTCFSDKLVRILTEHNTSWDMIIPKYPNTYIRGGTYLLFGISMWFKIDTYKFVMPVYYGCNVLDFDGILGIDFLHNIEPLQNYNAKNEKLIILQKPKRKYNFIYLWHDIIDDKYYYHPEGHTLVNIKKYYIGDAKSLIKNWDIWKKGVHYLDFKKSLTFKQIRAFMSLATNLIFWPDPKETNEQAEPAEPDDEETLLDSDDIWFYYSFLEKLKIRKFKKRTVKYFGSYSAESIITREYIQNLDDEMIDTQNYYLNEINGDLIKKKEMTEISEVIDYAKTSIEMIHLGSHETSIEKEDIEILDLEMIKYREQILLERINQINQTKYMEREIDEVSDII